MTDLVDEFICDKLYELETKERAMQMPWTIVKEQEELLEQEPLLREFLYYVNKSTEKDNE